ncbi:hypothetical protein JHK84_039760 [Glycine max]|nr:hypothetical protein JHK84_039760 [Glycine max]
MSASTQKRGKFIGTQAAQFTKTNSKQQQNFTLSTNSTTLITPESKSTFASYSTSPTHFIFDMNFLALPNNGREKPPLRLLEMVITVILLVLAFPSSLKTAESLNFNITNFNDPESAKNMAYQGDGKANNGSIELNIGGYLFRIGRALYGQPLRLWDSSSGVLN